MTPDALAAPDALYNIFLNINFIWLLLSFAGGAFGAMIGGNRSFGFVGMMILAGLGIAAGTGNTFFLDYVAFGPVFGPHISFAGAAAAAAYASKRGVLATGKDLNSALAGLRRPDVLLVGAVFGGGAYFVQRLVLLIPWFGSHTDSVALTVVLSGLAARLIFGSTPLSRGLARPSDDAAWLRWQETPAQVSTIAGFSSLMAAGVSVMVAGYVVPLGSSMQQYPQIANSAHVLPFAISALCILFLASGHQFPVTHHMTIVAGLAAVQFFMLTGNSVLAVLVGTVFGVVSGFVGELAARVFYDDGDTHIDPPAVAIAIMTTVIWIVLIPFQS